MAVHQHPGKEVETSEVVKIAHPAITRPITGESRFLEICETHPRMVILESLSPSILALHAILGI